MDIKKAAVIGAGVMGAGIAAHIANAGVPVILFDIVPEGANERSIVARKAIAAMKKTDPAPFMHPRAAKLVEPANIEDDLGKLADVDWIVEAVIERLDIKQGLYKNLEKHRKKGSIVSSNTSTIPLAQLTKGMPESFQQDFVVTHFFNPPRYLRLLEIVAGPKTRSEVVEAITAFGDVRLGKGVVACKDTPGFIANRIGTMWIQAAVNEAVDRGLGVEEADAIIGKPMGVPKTGVFGLIDLVGLDLMPHVGKSLWDNVPKDDPYKAMYRESAMFQKMIDEGYTGRKGKGGFYRLNREGGKRVKEAIDLATGEYRPAKRASLESIGAGRKGLKALVTHPDKGGQYAWAVLSQTLSYAALLVPDIADDITQVDEAMRLGYAWKWGPFELIDRLGAQWFAEKLAEDGKPVPALLRKLGDGTFYRETGGKREYFGTDGKYHEVRRADGVLSLEDIKRATKRIAGNGSASLWDIGDSVLCLEFHTKMNAIDAGVLEMVAKAIGIVEKDYKALVIYNEGVNFSVGANIGLPLFAANVGAWPVIEQGVQQGQNTYKKLKFSPFPVVGAPAGMALGGGCEVLLHCDAIQANAETYTGLVEVGVGLLPGWGGSKEMIARWMANERRPGGPMPAVGKAFEQISTAQVSRSANLAQDMMILRPGDGITMNRERLLADAKKKALSLVEGYTPPEPAEFNLPGPSAYAAMTMAVSQFVEQGKASEHDALVGAGVATVLSGGDTDLTESVSEDDLLRLERQEFMKLVRTPKTLARIEHTLETGKPLRN
ncbi:MAG: 3-hydroxyacyl-CoA dehydrogenase NAD-binding domain-containing protein [Alphaproteobacteria bacterium]